MFITKEENATARNKHPEETVDLIVKTAVKLFFEKGYEKTTIKDIIDNLGGLSKGAIYHHFKSKDDILEAVFNKMFLKSNENQFEIMANPNMNARQKIRQMFYNSIAYMGELKEDDIYVLKSARTNSQMFMMQYLSCINEVVPLIIAPLIKEGILDGSLNVLYPRAAGEIIILLTNLWIAPYIARKSLIEYEENVRTLGIMAKSVGIDIVDEEIVQKYLSCCKKLS